LHRQKQRRLYFHESDLIPNPKNSSQSFAEKSAFQKATDQFLSAKDNPLNIPKNNIPSNNFNSNNQSSNNQSSNNQSSNNFQNSVPSFQPSSSRVFQSSSSFNNSNTGTNHNFGQKLNSPQSAQLFIKQIPRNAAYRDMLHALTSGFLPHVWIDVQVKKSRSYVYRFKKCVDIQLTHGPFTWSIMREWRQIENLFQTIKSNKERSKFDQILEKAQDMVHRKYTTTRPKGSRRNSGNQQPHSTSNTPNTLEPPTLSFGRSVSMKVNQGQNQGDLLSNSAPAATLKNLKKQKSNFQNCTNAHQIQHVDFPEEKCEDLHEMLKVWFEYIVNSRECRTMTEVQRFLTVTRLSFIEDFGKKHTEIYIKKMSGGYFGKSELISKLSFFSLNFLFKRSSDKIAVVKDSCICYLSADEQELRGVMLFDSQFFVEPGNYSSHVIISNSTRVLKIKCKDHHDARKLIESVENAVDENEHGRLLIKEHRFNSFAPVRNDSDARWFVCGRDYMHYLSCVLEAAQSEIFIADWQMSPKISLRRPDPEKYWTLEAILKRKAEKGVRICIQLFDAPTLTLDHGLEETQRIFDAMHDKNVQVLMHASTMEHLKLWSHHEKLAIIDQKISFVGGIDLCVNRWEDENYYLFDHQQNSSTSSSSKLTIVSPSNQSNQTSTQTPETDNPVNPASTFFPHGERAELFAGKDYQNPFTEDCQSADHWKDQLDRATQYRMPWHDVHSVVYGQAAADVARHFIQRWNFTKQNKIHKDKTNRITFLLPVSTEPKTTSVTKPEFLSPLPENASRQYPSENPFPVSAQCVRSFSRWSGGVTETEHSILNAYLKLIESAEHYIYIENQFFITSSLPEESPSDQPDLRAEVRNKIGLALCQKIIDKKQQNKPFKVYIVMPLMPCFKGDILDHQDSSANAIKAVLHFQYSSICRDQKSGNGQENYSMYRRLKEGGVSKPEDFISFCSLRTNSMDPRGEKLVTEIVYVHSKLMIVDDRATIIGSANINDRSQLGDRDSEVCMVYEDKLASSTTTAKLGGHERKVGNFARSLRKRIWSIFLGKTEEEISDFDPSSDEFFKKVWRGIAKNNERAYYTMFLNPPSNQIQTNEQLRNVREMKNENDKVASTKQLKDINGVLVEMPLQFLEDENFHPSTFGITKEGLAPTDLWI